MLRSEKEELVKELNEKFSRAKSAVLAEFAKVDVATVTQLRKKFRDGGVDYKVLKNTLAKRAAKGTAVEVISSDFHGQVALALGYGDVVQPAKILSEFIKDRETIKIRLGMVDGKKIDATAVSALAKMPSLGELRAKLAGLIQQPAGKLVRTLAAPGAQLARVLKAREEQLAKQS